MEQAEFEKRAEELDRLGKELAQRESRLKALEQLRERLLPASLIDLIDCADDESLERSVKLAEEIFRGEVRKQVDERLSAGSRELPGAGVKDENDMTDAEFYTFLNEKRRHGR